MPIITCPNCNVRFPVDAMNTDVVHQCSSGVKANDEEDVLVVGDWEDYSGSKEMGTQKAAVLKFAGVQNILQGSRADEDLEDMSARGRDISRWRQRPHLEFIDLRKNG